MFGSSQKRVSIWRNCPACGGTGRATCGGRGVSARGFMDEESEHRAYLYAQGICLACKGTGGQYFDVLEGSPESRVE